MAKEILFEDMSSEEQYQKLKAIENKVDEINKEKIANNNYYVIDISFNRLSDGEIVYDVTYNDPSSENSINHEFYRNVHDDILPALIDEKELQNLQLIGSLDTSLIEKRQDEIKKIPSNNDDKKISLTSIEKQKEDLEKTAKAVGIPEEQIKSMTKIEGQTAFLDYRDLLKNSIASESIDGNEKISTYFTMNKILDLDYQSYRVIKNLNGASFIIGIKEDGSFDIIDNNKLEVVNAKEMSLMRTDGSLKEVGVSIAFKLKDPTSPIRRDQSFGLYNDNGRYGAFYARGANTEERMLGEEIPCESYSRKNIKEKEILDIRENKDVDEAKSAMYRTENGRTGKTETIAPSDPTQVSRDELIQKYAKLFGINVDDFTDKLNHDLEQEHDQDATDEELIKNTAEALSDENELLENNDKHELNDDDDEIYLSHGTPWGNPNQH